MLIKVEAINIHDFVYGVQDLSAVRGGSLMLLDMPERFGEWLTKTFANTRKLTAGASKAVFHVDTAKDQSKNTTAAGIKEAAHLWLREQCPHATIAVAALETGEQWDFFEMDELLTAQIRQEQMRSFSFAGLILPEGEEVCAWDHVQPATQRINAKGETGIPVSAATYDRHARGNEAKQTFLHRHAGLPGSDEWEYTWDLEELASWKPAGQLDAKIAVFCVDGNAFGKLLRDALGGRKMAEEQISVIAKFDQCLQGKRKEFLRNLLERAAQEHWKTPDGKRRVELLLWGGDEAMLVVPAWCGWEVAELFMETMCNARFQEGEINAPLKHAMGLVFAHHKAPIHELARLARRVVEDEAKGDRLKDRLSYLVLESFDHVGEDLGRFRELRAPDKEVRKGMVLTADGGKLQEMRQALQQLKQAEFPRRKVYQAVLELSRGRSWSQIKDDIEPFIDRPEWSEPLKKWQSLTGGEQASWYHLAELWDYIGTEL